MNTGSIIIDNAVAVTPENALCFAGYYDKCPWDETERYLLFHQVEFQDHAPTANDLAKICVLDTETNAIKTIGETYAWNFQQGAMLQWLYGQRVLYNVRIDGQFRSRIYDLKTRATRTLDRPVSAVSRDGKFAVSINFARLATWRPGYGYEGGTDPWANVNWPEDDGVYLMNIETGESNLIASLASVLKLRHEDNVAESFAWFNHTLFSPDGKRILFLNRWRLASEPRHRTRMLTADLDGGNIVDLMESYLISHFDWKGSDHIIAWAEVDGKRGFFLIEDKTGKTTLISEALQIDDGHCSYSADNRFVLLDTYPIDDHRALKIYDSPADREILLGRYYANPEITGPFRCDLHPKWSRTSRKVAFDSIHEGYRRVYVFDLDGTV